jgi:uncharacterized protein
MRPVCPQDAADASPPQVRREGDAITFRGRLHPRSEFCQELPMAISKELLDLLVCPVSKGALELTADGKFLVCRESKLVYRIEDDIPIMLADEAIPLDEWERQQRGGA